MTTPQRARPAKEKPVQESPRQLKPTPVATHPAASRGDAQGQEKTARPTPKKYDMLKKAWGKS
jgi:hypothetical protein